MPLGKELWMWSVILLWQYCQSVCLSICLSVTLWYCIETNAHIVKLFQSKIAKFSHPLVHDA